MNNDPVVYICLLAIYSSVYDSIENGSVKTDSAYWEDFWLLSHSSQP